MVSVIMPVYNGEKTIEPAIRSLLNQTYTQWQCIIVDDGSNDGTARILERYRDDPRFQIISLPENRGRGYARQTGLDRCVGTYVAYLDADDIYHPDKLAIQVRTMEEHGEVPLVSCGIGAFDEEMKLRSVRGKGDGIAREFNARSLNWVFSPASSLVRLSEARKIRYRTGLNVAEDVDYFRRLLTGKKLMMLDEVLYFYFEFGSTTSKKILSYYRQALRSKLHLVRDNFILGIRHLSVSLAKYAIYALVLPFAGADFFLKRRGMAPDEREKEEFEKTVKLINSAEYAEN